MTTPGIRHTGPNGVGATVVVGPGFSSGLRGLGDTPGTGFFTFDPSNGMQMAAYLIGGLVLYFTLREFFK